MSVVEGATVFFLQLLLPEILLLVLFKEVGSSWKLRYIWQVITGHFKFIKTEIVVIVFIIVTATSFVVSNELFNLLIGLKITELVSSINLISQLLLLGSTVTFTILTLTIYGFDKNWDKRHYKMLAISLVLGLISYFLTGRL